MSFQFYRNYSFRIALTRLAAASAAVSLFCCLAGEIEAQILTSFTEPYETYQLATAEPGRVGQVYVKLGQHVVRKQLILGLDNRVLELSRRHAWAKAAASGKIDYATAEFRLKSSRLEKMKSVQSSGFASNTEIEIAETEAAAAKAKLQIAEDERALYRIEIEQIDAQIDQRLIRSPIEGVVIELRHQTGEFISSSNPETAIIASLEQLKAKFHLLTEQASRLSTGQAVKLSLPQEEETVPAIIEYIAPVTSAKSLTVRVDVVIDNHENRIRSGVPVQIQLDSITP